MAILQLLGTIEDSPRISFRMAKLLALLVLDFG